MRVIIIITILLILGCGIFNSDEEVEREITPFSWSVRKSFPGEGGKSLWISKKDEILVSADNSWFISNDKGNSFTEYSVPDSVFTWDVKKIDNTFYGFGQYRSNYHVIAGDTTENTLWFSHLFYKSNDGENWEKLSGPYDMYDFNVFGNKLYIGTYGGIVTVDLLTKKEIYSEFLTTNSLDIVNGIELNSKGDVFVGTHDGVYRSIDEGATFDRVSEEINKDIDQVEKIIIRNDGTIYAIGNSLLKSNDNGENWEVMNFKIEDYDGEISGLFLDDFNISKDGYMYAINYLGFFIADTSKGGVFEFHGAHKYDFSSSSSLIDYENIFVLADGDIFLSRWDNYVYHIGSRNHNSQFWSD